MPVFLDTSALVKLYVREPGTDWMLGLANDIPPGQLVLSSLAEVELHSALRLLERTGKIASSLTQAISAAFREDSAWRYSRQAVTDHVLGLAITLVDRHGLRAYDAVQLGSCLAFAGSASSLRFISSDRELLRAAAAEQLECSNPLDG